MRAMTFPENRFERRALAVAVVVSLAIHGLLLFVNHQKPTRQGSPLPRLEASLARQTPPAKAPQPIPSPPPKKLLKTPEKPQTRPRVMAIQQASRSTVPSAQKWTLAEQAEMNDFLSELSNAAQAKAQPTLAQRSLAMARDDARQMARQEKSETLSIERRPNSPDPDPFSLELYFEGLLKNLNRSAAYVKNDPKSRGIQTAAVQFRVNPDGTLKSFTVLNAADQGDGIAFIKAVVERAAPFSPFPPDLNRSARSMAVRICIMPARGGGFGFSKSGEGQGC